MSYVLVRFVEDGIYHVCSIKHVKYDIDEIGLVSAKYKGVYYRAVTISEGDRDSMDRMKTRCIANDELMAKYKFPSPQKTSTASSAEPSHLSANVSTAHNVPFLKKEDSGALMFPSSSFFQSYEYEIEHENPGLPTSSNDETRFRENTQEIQEISSEKVAELGALELHSKPRIQSDVHQIKHRNVDAAEISDVETGLEVNRGEIQDMLPENVEMQETPSTKKYYCPFCCCLISKFARHLFQVHCGEDEVKAISKLPVKDADRVRAISRLRGRGTRMFNLQPSSKNKFLTLRRKSGMKIEEYIACHMCGNMYKKPFLYRHVKRCPSGLHPGKKPLREAKEMSLVVEEENQNFIQFSRDVMSGLREGDVKNTIMSDPFLVDFGKYLCALYGQDIHLVNLIRKKLRQLAEVLLECKKLDEELNVFEDLFQSRKKNLLFQAIKNVTGFFKGSFKRPAMANELGTLLQKCAMRLISRAIEENNENKVSELNRWIQLLKSDYNVFISKHARRSLEENKWNKPRTLPLTEDLIKLNQHVKFVIEKASTVLKSTFEYIQWSNLAKATLVKFLVFNRKRVGDVQRLKIDDFKKAHNVQHGSITYDMLSESERLTCSHYVRVETRGKHGKVVPLLLTKDMVKNINLIISFRGKAQLPSNNQYVFSNKGTEPFSASKTLTEFAYECQATFPQFITSTKLRKQIATAAQAFNFSQNELTVLANFLGHTLQTHSNFYRMPDEALHLAKISKVLELIDSGKASVLRGKSLAELENYLCTMIERDDNANEGDESLENVQTSPVKTPKKIVKIARRTWSTLEKVAMRSQFRTHLENRTLPTHLECDGARRKFSPLKVRTVAQIKAWVNNQNVKGIKRKL